MKTRVSHRPQLDSLSSWRDDLCQGSAARKRKWTPPAKLAIMAIRRYLAGLTMRRLVLLLCLLAAGALPAQAAALRFPPTGKHAFLIDLPKGWQTKTDARGGLLLIPPSQSKHAMI